MARIPEYKQGQIVSQNVGTAGVDTSATALANANADMTNTLSAAESVSNSGFAAGLANVAAGIVTQVGRETRLAAHAYKQAISERRVADAMYSSQSALRNFRAQVKEEANDNPMVAHYAYKAKADKFLNDQLMEMKKRGELPEVMNAYKTHMQPHILANTNAMEEWGFHTEKERTKQNFDFMMAETPKAMGNAKSVDDMLEAMTDLGTALPAYNKMLGQANVTNHVNKAMRDGALQFLHTKADQAEKKAPEVIEELLKDERLKGFGLKSTDVEKVRDHAKIEHRAAVDREHQEIVRLNGIKIAEVSDILSVSDDDDESVDAANKSRKQIDAIRTQIRSMPEPERLKYQATLNKADSAFNRLGNRIDAIGRAKAAAAKAQAVEDRRFAADAKREERERRTEIRWQDYLKSSAEQDRKRTFAQLRESPEAEDALDRIDAKHHLLMTPAEALKKGGAKEAESASKLIDDIYDARDKGLVSAKETRAAMSAATEVLTIAQARAKGGVQDNAQMQAKIYYHTKLAAAPPASFLRNMNLGADPLVAKKLRVAYGRMVQEGAEKFATQLNIDKTKITDAGWENIYAQAVMNVKRQGVK